MLEMNANYNMKDSILLQLGLYEGKALVVDCGLGQILHINLF